MMSRAIKAVGFKFHPRCEKLQLTILCFGDNKIVFTSADLGSVSEEFCHTQKTQRITKKNSMKKKNKEKDRGRERE